MNYPGIFWLLALASLACSADEVRVTTLQGAERTHRGRVIDYGGEGVKLETETGREVVFPVDRVIGIQASWLPPQVEADELYARAEFAPAARLYGEAFRQESRRWVKRKLLSQVVRCQRNLGKEFEACKNFARLVADDPGTPFFDAIPLAWSVVDPEPELKKLSQEWVDDARYPVRQLLAVSWLLTTGDRAAAVRSLRTLTRHKDSRIADLASTQSWRLQEDTVSLEQLAVWNAKVRGMPLALRAGPYFILGRAYAKWRQTDDAMLALMRVPTTYGEHHTLALSALLESGRLMQRAGKSEEAMQLFRKTVAWDADSREADQAKRRLAELQ